MKISKKEDYGLIFMSVLARKYSKDFVSLVSVAKETNLSSLFLKHLASVLLKDKLIESKEGVNGGYRLTRNPRNINMGEIMKAISEGMIIPSCKGHICKLKKAKCACFSLWNKVNDKVFKYLSDMKLSDFSSL
jgi:Rrf2 family iron-sulfur cluster assembly transcriptional regulator